jgi:hypothetical protein
MTPGDSRPLRIVRTIPGQSTGGSDDILVAEDGSRWKYAPQNSGHSATTVPATGRLINGYLLKG